MEKEQNKQKQKKIFENVDFCKSLSLCHIVNHIYNITCKISSSTHGAWSVLHCTSH